MLCRSNQRSHKTLSFVPLLTWIYGIMCFKNTVCTCVLELTGMTIAFSWCMTFSIKHVQLQVSVKCKSFDSPAQQVSWKPVENYCGYYISTPSTLYVLLPLADKLFMSVMAFCWSCPFPSSNPGSNKRGLTSVTRAYKSPLLQMESATEWGMEVSG